VCNNRQLADVVNKRPAKLAELGHLNGFADAKLKKYGAEILALIATAGPRPPEAPNPFGNAFAEKADALTKKENALTKTRRHEEEKKP